MGMMEKKMETTIVYWGNLGIMERKMEITTVCWGNLGIVEKKMETTIMGFGIRLLGFGFWGGKHTRYARARRSTMNSL